MYNFTEMEQLVREATCNDGKEPAPMLLKEIAKGTFTVDFSNIMSIVWKPSSFSYSPREAALLAHRSAARPRVSAERLRR